MQIDNLLSLFFFLNENVQEEEKTSTYIKSGQS